MLTPYSLIYSTHNGDDAPLKKIVSEYNSPSSNPIELS